MKDYAMSIDQPATEGTALCWGRSGRNGSDPEPWNDHHNINLQRVGVPWAVAGRSCRAASEATEGAVGIGNPDNAESG